MAAVTQLTPNFLGGVSRQTDDKKLDGQVVDIINGYPDPTYGLTKRQSTYFLWNLKKTDGTFFSEGELDNAFWFNAETKVQVTAENQGEYPPPRFAIGDVVQTPYICAIHNANIYVWDSFTGEPKSVTNNATAYLTRPDGSFYGEADFHHRTILDTTIICNRNAIPAMKPNTTTFTPGLVGTVRLNAVVPEKTYTIVINGTPYAHPVPEEGQSPEQVLDALKAKIPATFNPVVYKTSIELSASSPFTLSVKDSQSNDLLNSYQDTVLNQTLLANPSKEGRLVEVIGAAAAGQDNYYLQFKDTVWEETVNPTVTTEFDTTTMPHRLFIEENGTFTFGPIEYVNRLVGDDDSNPVPTFVGTPINASFYYNNRLGFLSGANVIMSQARDVYNFFKQYQIISTDADPIDLNANSTRPVELYEVVTQPQGVLIFGTRQQFWLAALDAGVLTPTGSSIQTISSYEADRRISPLDIGTTIGFVSKTPDYSKLMIMQGQGSDVDPIVVEISKVVTGWLPNDINRMAVSPQNSFVVLTGKDDNDLYIYRFYNDGSEDRMQAWCKWRMPGPVQALIVANDMMFMVTSQGGRYTASMVSLNSLDKSGMQLTEDTFKPGSPYLDFLVRPTSTSYDSTTGETKLYVDVPLLADRQAQMVVTLPGMIEPNPGSYIELFQNMKQLPRTEVTDPGYYLDCTQGSDAGGNYFLAKGDLTEYVDSISVGYTYDYEVILPKFYYKLSSKNNAGDYTAHLNVNRAKFAVGLTGGIKFKLKAMGNDEWVDIQHVTDADYYEADTDPLKSEQMFTVPINQRNKHFQLKVTSDLPFPVSLVSMMWEGQYTPRFYRRA